MNSPNEHLGALLADIRPEKLLLISRSPTPAVEAHLQQHQNCQLTERSFESFDRRDQDAPVFDLAVVADTLEHLDHAAGLELVGMLRNRFASRVYLVLSENGKKKSVWTDADFFSLGMQRAGDFERGGQVIRIYTYDLETYNRKRDWNSPKNWANPENFGKYWW